MEHKVIIQGRFPGMNEYTSACRGYGGRFKGNNMKSDCQDVAAYHILAQLRGVQIRQPVRLHYTFYEANKKRDHDNVAGFAHKVIQDALVAAGKLTDDGWDEIVGYSDDFILDRKNPRIELIIEEVEEDG